MKFKVGDQVSYLPTHADGDANHKDVEHGFVSSCHKDGSSYFCRYWIKGKPGVLRTVSNSELTSEDHLIPAVIRVPQSVVNDFLIQINLMK